MASSRDKLLKQFRMLVDERLSRIGKHLMDLESGPSAEAGKQALRELHGLKGEARMMGFAEINNIVHEMEELVRVTEPAGYALTGGSADALLSAADAVGVLAKKSQGPTDPMPDPGALPDVAKLLEWIKQRVQAEGQSRGAPPAEAAPAPAPAESGPALPGPPPAAAAEVAEAPVKAAPAPVRAARPEGGIDSTVKIDQATLDRLTAASTSLAQLARRRELASPRRLTLARELAQIARVAEDLGAQAAPLVVRLNRVKELAADLHRDAKLLVNAELRDLSVLTEEIQILRMLPLSVLFEPYPRMVRDLAKELGKEVDLVLEGEGTMADRSVVEALRDPLMHLVRNALDHGLEPRAERVRVGKSPRGRLGLKASREGERILLEVSDDGAGLDPQALRRAAVKKGLLDEAQALALSDAAARELIFVAGFSSKEAITDISGRGVGLDVVRVRLQALGGDVSLTSAPGQGTLFQLRVPVSLTVAPLLFIQVGDEQLCLTAAHVLTALKVDVAQVRELAGRPALKVADDLYPFASISSILGQAPERPPSEGELVLLVHGQGATAAISVDRVLEERMQAILPLKGVLARFKHLAGATPLADGSLAMVLSAAHLLSSAHGKAALRISSLAARPTDVRRRRILVVDDSPLTRELISSLLETVGYEIVNANDGAEAFDFLVRESVDMVVTDLEMPNVDGLELTRRLKAHPTLRSLPVVIVTTRGAEADRRKGMEAGADGYIAKGDLVRQDLVDVVGRLLG